MKLVRVEWIDIHGLSDWQPRKKARKGKFVKCVSVGWVLNSNKKRLVLFASRNSNKEVGDVTTIPTGSIRRIIELGGPHDSDT